MISAVAERYADRALLHVIMGGLRAGNTAQMDAASKATIRHHWEHVQEASGQPFDFAFFDREGFVYDTEPPCRAVVAVRSLADELALPYLARLQMAFYSDNQDVTSTDTLTDLATELKIDGEHFRRAFDDDRTRSATTNDFQLSARMGVTGFPTLLGRDEDQLVLLTSGYRPFSDLTMILDRWFESPRD